MKQPYKRERDDDLDTHEPTSKHRRTSNPALLSAHQGDPLLPTPVHSAASPEQQACCPSQPPWIPSKPAFETCKPLSNAPSAPWPTKPRQQSTTELERQPVERQPVELQAAKPKSSWFVDYWQEKTALVPVTQGNREEGCGKLPTELVEGNDSTPTVGELSDWARESDQMSQTQDAGGSRGPGSAVSERLKTSSPMYRGTLKMNKVIIDDYGTEIPRDVEQLVTKHIRKQRNSPRLGDDEKASILRKVKLVWNSPEPIVTDIMALPLLPFGDLDHVPSLAPGGDILWSRAPLPKNVDYPLVTPKTDRHLGYQPTLTSEWTARELAAADHPKVRPFSQPTRENIFPSFLCEGKSEATGGTPYAAESQLATAGCHRVNSMLWILDHIAPARIRKSSDAIVFSAVCTQRQVIAHVHYYDPESDMFRMSFVDSFYLAKDLQECVDFRKNIEEWLVEIQQPVVREALRDMYPITQLWNKGRPASVVADDVDSSFDGAGARSVKNMRIE